MAARRRYVPPEHGAWAMLLVPFVLGSIVGGPAWVHLPLLVAAVAGYLLSYFAFLAVKTRKPGRVRHQVVLYSAIALPAALTAVALRPVLLAFAPAYIALIALNAWYAKHGSQRAFVNDFASVLQGCLILPLAVVASGAPAGAAIRPFLLTLLYFVGTVFYVKTMIRERGNPAYLRASITYHAGATAAAAAIAWLSIPLFAWFLIRAALLPRRHRRPLQVGLVEIGNSLALITTVALVAR